MKIIFIEGLPGSGKTTFAKKIHQAYQNHNQNVHLYKEGDQHPIDLAWIAIFDQKQYDNLLIQFPSLKNQIESQVVKEGNQYYLAYTKIKIDASTKDFFDVCENHEIYKKDDLSEFLNIHLKRYKNFIDKHKTKDDVYIFECILIQNHINELLLKHGYKSEQIYQYFIELMEPIKEVDYEILYIQQLDVGKTLKRITEERRTTDKALYRDWIDLVIDYISNTPYGSDYKDFSGCLSYFEIRLKEEIKLLEKLKDHISIFDLDEDYDHVLFEMKAQLGI
jgi:hypothetical protein